VGSLRVYQANFAPGVSRRIGISSVSLHFRERAGKITHAKLDELLLASRRARNELAGIEELEEEEKLRREGEEQ